MVLHLLLGMALAADPQPAEIKLVPQGTVLIFPGGASPKYTVPVKSFLLPGPYYDSALATAKQLAICQPALDSCTQTSTETLAKLDAALTASKEQSDKDATLISDLTTQVKFQGDRADALAGKLKHARQSQWTAWGITGGLVLGAVTVVAISR